MSHRARPRPRCDSRTNTSRDVGVGRAVRDHAREADLRLDVVDAEATTSHRSSGPRPRAGSPSPSTSASRNRWISAAVQSRAVVRDGERVARHLP